MDDPDQLTIGIDEVGYGSWAGPLTLGGVALVGQVPYCWPEVRDSKRCTERYRNRIFTLLRDDPGVEWHTVSIPPETIDKQGLSYAMHQGISLLLTAFEWDYNANTAHGKSARVLIDGENGFGMVTPVLHGDNDVPEISAASIMAKVTRDTYMRELAKKDARYGFANNKGYGTAAHRAALETWGPIDEHRRLVSWIRETWGPRGG